MIALSKSESLSPRLLTAYRCNSKRMRMGTRTISQEGMKHSLRAVTAVRRMEPCMHVFLNNVRQLISRHLTLSRHQEALSAVATSLYALIDRYPPCTSLSTASDDYGDLCSLWGSCPANRKPTTRSSMAVVRRESTSQFCRCVREFFSRALANVQNVLLQSQ